MASIRTHTGQVHLCASCGQPSFDGEYGPEHFSEQWDGVHCPRFPLAGDRIVIAWAGMSLETLRQQYPDTYPR
ncbi:hypothetical protein AB0451_03350 [Streptomyces sp. NPDC052000]|uniref:hypothetical protein n=1 Tax=Streptomyces sp. NPDC052000 TaxID=3155676 RepID=UPI00344E516D